MARPAAERMDVTGFLNHFNVLVDWRDGTPYLAVVLDLDRGLHQL